MWLPAFPHSPRKRPQSQTSFGQSRNTSVFVKTLIELDQTSSIECMNRTIHWSGITNVISGVTHTISAPGISLYMTSLTVPSCSQLEMKPRCTQPFWFPMTSWNARVLFLPNFYTLNAKLVTGKRTWGGTNKCLSRDCPGCVLGKCAQQGLQRYKMHVSLTLLGAMTYSSSQKSLEPWYVAATAVGLVPAPRVIGEAQQPLVERRDGS